MLLLALACTKDEVIDSSVDLDCSTADYSLIPASSGELEGGWDAERNRFVFFGGNMGVPVDCSPSATDFTASTWAFNTDCGDFEAIAEGPAARGRYASAIDAERGLWLIHGGRFRDGDGGGGHGGDDYTLYDELWGLDLATDTWSLLHTGGPKARVNHVAEIIDGQFVIYGGNTSKSGASFRVRSDVWSYDIDGNAWTELSPGGDDPGGRLFHASARGDDGTIYVYGGGDENAFFGPFFGDLFALDTASWTWTQLHDGSGAAPDGRIVPNLAVDDDNNRVILFGGHDDGELGNTNQIWSFDLGTGAWTELSAGDVYANEALGQCDFPADFTTVDLESPERRYSAASAEVDGGLMIFGGKTDCGVINDVWTWDFAAESWTENSSATSGEVCLRAFAECESLCF